MKCDPQAARDELFSFLTWSMKERQINFPPAPSTLSIRIKTELKGVIVIQVSYRCFNDSFGSIRIVFW